MSDFYMPAWDDLDETGEDIPEAGRHDCTITQITLEEAKSSGRDMMVCQCTIDNGEQAGMTFLDRFVFSTPKQFGEKKLKRMLKAAGFRYEQKPTVREFVAQFPENKLRVSILIEHSYSIERDTGWENDIPRSVWDSFEGKKNVKADVSNDRYNDYKPADKPPSLDLSGMQKNGAASGDGAQTDAPKVGFGEGEVDPF